MSNFRDAHPDGKRKKARSAGTRRTHEEREILHLTPAALWFLHAVISPRLQIKGGEWTELNIARIAARKDAKFSERAIRTGLVRLRACAPILGLKFRRQYKQGGKRGRCHLGWLVADVAWLHERKTDEEPLFWTGTKRRHIKDENREPVEPKPYGLLKPAQARQEGHWKTAVKASAPGPSIFLGGDDHPAHSAPHTPYHEQPIGNHSRVTRTSRRAKRPRQDSVALLPASTLSEKQRRWSFFEARSRCEPHSESVNRVQLADADAECGDGRCLATITLNSFRHCVALALANGLPPPLSVPIFVRAAREAHDAERDGIRTGAGMVVHIFRRGLRACLARAAGPVTAPGTKPERPRRYGPRRGARAPRGAASVEAPRPAAAPA